MFGEDKYQKLGASDTVLTHKKWDKEKNDKEILKNFQGENSIIREYQFDIFEITIDVQSDIGICVILQKRN